VFSEAPYFLTVFYRSKLYFLIFSYSVERSIEIGMSLADGGVPVEDSSQGYPEADWDTVRGDMFLEQNPSRRNSEVESQPVLTYIHRLEKLF
jgi:hypothetical protein